MRINRFIPVDTGNTSRWSAGQWWHPVHPRGYGEHISGIRQSMTIHGSSPWIRGTLFLWCTWIFPWRFIPVDTGNTGAVKFCHDSSPVHPRGYGEHILSRFISCLLHGSSPWIRGTPRKGGYSIVRKRFIPVDTGNTICTNSAFCLPAVHPRGYGEH